MALTDDTAAEYTAEEKAKRPERVHAPRGSWWQTADGTRTIVVLGLWFQDLTKLHQYELSEKGRPQPFLVGKDVFEGQVKAGTLKRIW